MDERDDEIKSKSQLKREHQSLQQLGRTLVELPDAMLRRLALPEHVRDEVMTGRRLQRGALQRHLRHLAGVLEREDPAAIRAALQAAQAPDVAEVRKLHALEALRDRLLHEGDAAIDEVIGRYPQVDRTQLRQLVRNARQAAHARSAARQLFQFLKSLHAESAHTDVPRVDR